MDTFAFPLRQRSATTNASSAEAPTQSLRPFAYYSANMHHLLPGKRLSGIYGCFQRTRALRIRNSDPHGHLAVVEHLRHKPDFADSLRLPGVIVSFHYGAYPALCGYLMAGGIPFALVLSSETHERQMSSYKALYTCVTGQPYSPDRFELIDAGKPSSLLTMRRAIAKGRHVICFADGNAGVGKNERTNLLDIPFLYGKLRVRAGAAFLAHWVGCPLYTAVMMEQAHGDIDFRSGTPLFPSADPDWKGFSEQAMKGAYALLGDQIQHRIADWEAWQYIQDDIVTPSLPQKWVPSSSADFYDRYAPFCMRGGTFVLDKFQYRAFRIKPEVYADILPAYLDLILN